MKIKQPLCNCCSENANQNQWIQNHQFMFSLANYVLLNSIVWGYASCITYACLTLTMHYQILNVVMLIINRVYLNAFNRTLNYFETSNFCFVLYFNSTLHANTMPRWLRQLRRKIRHINLWNAILKEFHSFIPYTISLFNRYRILNATYIYIIIYARR